MRFKSKVNDYLNEAANASATTRLQEGLHCVFFGAKQKRKDLTNVMSDPDLLEAAYKTYCSVDAPFGELYTFGEKQPTWVTSITEAANVLFASGWLKGKYTYHRNDAYMNAIYAQFNSLKKYEGVTMGNDKWNPGDVWASKGNVPIPEVDSLAEYNAWIAEMLHSGKLLGISLKKIKGSGTVKLEGDPAADVSKRKFMGVKKPRNIYPTGVMLLADKNAAINFRSFRVSKEADVTGEVLKAGTGARHGKVPAGRKKEMIKKYNIPQMTKAKIAKSSDEDLQNYVLELWMDVGYVFGEADIAKYIKERSKKISNRTGYWQSVIHALEIGAFMTAHKSVANTIMDYWYKGASSTTADSSQFIKVY